MAAPVVLLEARPRSAADGVAAVVRLAGGGAEVPYRYGGEHWRAGIAGLPKIISRLDHDGEQLGGGGVAQAMELRWGASSNAALAAMAARVWADAPVTVRIGPEGEALPPVAAQGLVLDAAVDGGMLAIALADQAVDLKRPVLVDRYAGTGGIEGPAESEGQIKPRTWGRCFNVAGRPLDTGADIWVFSDPRRPLLAIDQVRDKGAIPEPETMTTLDWKGSAEATFAALRAAPVVQGGGVVAPSIACVKWWTQPAGDLRADIRGETAGGYVETAPAIVGRIVAARSAILVTPAAIAAAVAARPAPFGWRVESEEVTAADTVSEMLAGVSLSWVLVDGALGFRPWDWTAPTRTARSQGVSRRSTFKPVAGRKLGYRRNWSPAARGDLAAIVLTKDVLYEDGRPLSEAVEEAGKTAEWERIADPTGRKPDDNATNGADLASAFGEGTVGGVVTRLGALDIALAAARVRQDTLERETIPAIDRSVADAGERITAARGRADAAYQRAGQAIDDAATVNRRVDSIVAEGGYDDRAVRAEIGRVEQASTRRDEALAGRAETLEASARSTNAALHDPGGVLARVKSGEDALADLPNRYAAASRTAALEAQVNGAADSGLQRTVNARIEERAAAIADARTGAVAQSVQALRAEYDGTAATVSRQAGAIVGVQGRTAAYVRYLAVAGSGRAQLTLSADANGGGGVDIVGDLSVSGSILLPASVGSIQIGSNAVTVGGGSTAASPVSMEQATDESWALLNSYTVSMAYAGTVLAFASAYVTYPGEVSGIGTTLEITARQIGGGGFTRVGRRTEYSPNGAMREVNGQTTLPAGTWQIDCRGISGLGGATYAEERKLFVLAAIR